MIIIVEPGDDDLPPPDEMAEELMQLGYPVSEIRVRRGNRHTRTVWAIVDQVLADPSASASIADIKAGKDKAIGYLVGQVMKKSNGKANPSIAQQLIRDKI